MGWLGLADEITLAEVAAEVVVAARLAGSAGDDGVALFVVPRDDVEAYACFRVGYHRGLDALRGAGWKGSGLVRWAHPANRGFLRCLDGLRSASGTTVTFADGSTEDFDLIIMATGYRHSVPYAQEYFSSELHPDLYLTNFSRQHAGLFGVSFTETNSGAYRHFDAAGQMIASYSFSANAAILTAADRMSKMLLDTLV